MDGRGRRARVAPLRDVGETAQWVAAYRALESERPDALFRDPLAQRLAASRGLELAASMPGGRAFAWSLVMRTMLFDRWIEEAVRAGADVVVNLAAGLDARPYRMRLPANLTWIEVDQPALLERKQALLAGERPSCRLERVAIDLADEVARQRLLAEIARRGRHGLVLTEGLLIYLTERQVAALARELAAHATFREWVTDLVSPTIEVWMRWTLGRVVARAGAPFRFAPAAGPRFFAPYGWRVTAAESFVRAAASAGRLPRWMRPLAWWPEPPVWLPGQAWAGVVRLERDAEPRK